MSDLVGVDIGGTFTDLVRAENGRLNVHKRLSSPANPAESMLEGLAALGVGQGARISHGSTVATNAILERKGARTALLTSAGFRDVLAIGRQNRPELYALQPRLPAPLIPRQWCYEVPERLDHRGQVLTALDITSLDRVIDAMAAEGIEAVAICFLYSFINPVHEQAARARFLERGFLSEHQISLSCEVLPQFREYERASTTALDAYVRPVMSRYLAHLEAHIPPKSRLLVMKSDGGLVSAAQIRRLAVQTALSGPAAGVIGAFEVAKLAGFTEIITLDMGGTSTDVALCPGAPGFRAEADLDGLPLRSALIDIETVGAGGGSIARLDTGGALRVGPQSAGADPGPIVYGRGGTAVTVSDANAALGRLDAEHFLGGAMRLHLEPALAALDKLGLGRDAAAGIIRIANVNIDRAIRRVSVARGYDPRRFTLVAFGGAGPLHACEVAEGLGIRRVLVPRYPGVMCALGLLLADIQREYSRAVLRPLDDSLLADLQNSLRDLIDEAQHDLAAEDLPPEAMTFHALADIRYSGQGYELSVNFSQGVEQAFHDAHQRRYGYALPGRPIEVVNLRLRAVGRVEKPPLEAASLDRNDGSDARLPDRGPYARYQRDRLRPGAALAGPALIFQMDSTTFIPPGWLAQVDAYHNLFISQD